MFERFGAAFQFLTILPLFPARRLSSEELARSMAAFPAVGLSLGVGLLLVHGTVGRRLPGLLEGAVLAGLLAWATGALHLDGLADTLDGLGGGWTRERALEIMKDSRTGAIGAAGLCLALVAKVAAFGLLPGEFAGRAILLTPAVARGGVVWLAYGSPYARPQGGLGSPYTQHLDSETARLALVVSAVPCLLLGWRGLAGWALTIAYAQGLKAFFRRKLGGITGDVMGFAVETGEIVFLLVLHVLA